MNLSDLKTAIRLPNAVLTALAVFIGHAIATNTLLLSTPILIAMAAAFLISAGGQSINDYFDFQIDSKQRPKYKSITLQNKNQLLILSILLFVIGNALAYQLPFLAFQIALAISLLLILYSAGLSQYKYVRNIIVALGTALPLVFGAALIGRFEVVAWLAGSALFANWCREIIKDCQDVAKDRGTKKTVPMLLPVLWIQILVSILLGFSVITALVPFYLGVFGNAYYLALVGIAILVFYYAYWQFFNHQLAKSQQTFKQAMIVALAGFLAGIL